MMTRMTLFTVRSGGPAPRTPRDIFGQKMKGLTAFRKEAA